MAGWWTGPDWAKMGGEDGDAAVIRREFLAVLLGIGGMSWPRRASIAAEVAGACRTGRELVDELDRVASGLAARWDDGNPAELRRQLSGLYAVVSHLAESATPMYRRDLQQIAGRTAALLGLLSRMRGRDDLAQGHLTAAKLWTLEAQDDHLRALALTFAADIDSAVQRGLAAPSGPEVRVDLDSAETLMPGAPPAVQALVLLRQAEEHAAAGEVDEALGYLDRADAAWAAPEGREAGLYGIGWGDGIMRAFRANVLLLAGRPADAAAILVSVLGQATGSNRIAAGADLAAAMARMGEVTESAEMLTAAWTAAQAAGLADRARRIRGIRQRELAGHVSEPAVRDLDEAIRAAR